MPLMHLITSLNSVLALGIAVKIFYSYQKGKDQSLKNFLGVFLNMGIYFGLVSLPGLIISNPNTIQLVYLVSYLPLFISVFFILLVFLNLFEFNVFLVKTIYVLIALLFLVLTMTLILNIVYFSPAFLHRLGPFYYWGEGTPFWLQAIDGIFLGFILLFISFIFFIEGKKSNEKIVRHKAFLISFGVAIFVISAISNFVFSVYFEEILHKLTAAIIAGILSFAAIAFIAGGVYYVPKEPPF